MGEFLGAYTNWLIEVLLGIMNQHEPTHNGNIYSQTSINGLV